MNIDLKIPDNFLFLWSSKKRFKVMKGGAGSGKSESTVRYILTRVINEKGCNVIVTRKIAKSLKLSVFPAFRRIINNNSEEVESPGLGLQKYFKINKSDLTIECLENGNMIYFVGMDDPEKIKSVTAPNGQITIVMMEEASEFEKTDLNQLNTRLRGKSKLHKEILLLFNPISEDHWLKQEFWNAKNYKSVYLSETNYTNNPFLDEAYKETLENYAKSDPYWYNVYCIGNWGVLSEYDVIIPYKLIYKSLNNIIEDEEGGLDVGVDPARFGDDEATIYIRRGLKTLDKKTITKKDKIEVTNRQMGKYIAQETMKLIGLYRNKQENVRIKIDIGAGDAAAEAIYDMEIPNITVYEIDFGGKAKNPNKYANIVTEMYFELKEIIPEIEFLKNDHACFSELSRRKYEYTTKVQKKIESKKDFKKRIMRSPDNADAFVLCFYNPQLTKATQMTFAEIVSKKLR